MSVRIAAIWALASQYASFTIQFVTSVILARWFITPDELGLFSIAFAAITLVAFLQDFGVTRYIAGERDLTEEKLQTAFTISVLFAWTIAVLSLLAAEPVAMFYDDPDLLPVAQVIAASYLLIPLAIVPQATCQRRLDFKSNTMIEVGAAIANGTVSITLAVKGHGAMALAWGAFAQQAARMLVAQWRAGVMLPWPLRIGDARPVLRIGGTNSILTICATITLRAPELVIGRIINNTAVGLFSRASGLALQLRMLLAGAVTGVFYPAFRQVRDRGDPLGPPYIRVVAAYTAITWPAMAGIALMAKPLVMFLYGEVWIEAAPLLGWIALSQIFYVALPLSGDLPLLLDRMGQLVRRNLVDTTVSVGLIILAAPFGLIWVAISRLVHSLFNVALYAGMMHAMLQFAWRDLLRVWALSALAALAAIAPTELLYNVWAGPSQAGFLQMIVSAGLGVLCWLATLYITRHPTFAEIRAIAQPVLERLSIRFA
jgi:O-antigen/teichoic acid export membrane protein